MLHRHEASVEEGRVEVVRVDDGNKRGRNGARHGRREGGCERGRYCARKGWSKGARKLNFKGGILSIYIIIRHCPGVGAFPRPFCVPNSVALASLTLQVGDWAIH